MSIIPLMTLLIVVFMTYHAEERIDAEIYRHRQATR